MKQISAESAIKLSRALTAKLGVPEGSGGALLGAVSTWEHCTSWRYRTDDGSGWARLGYGPTRKTVTLTSREKAGYSAEYFLSVHVAKTKSLS